MNQGTLNAKKLVVESLEKSISENDAMIVVEYRGLSVTELHSLKRLLRENDANLRVYKNSLVARAADNAGKGELKEILTGPNAIIFSKDVFASPKILAKFARQNEHLVLKGGLIEGHVVDSDTIKSLARIPGRDGLISMFLSCLQAPIRNLACAIKAVAEK